MHPQLLVSCRACLRPVALVFTMVDLEIAKLEQHVCDCTAGEAHRWTGARDDVLSHFRMVGDPA